MMSMRNVRLLDLDFSALQDLPFDAARVEAYRPQFQKRSRWFAYD
jgi:hypothetical protein